MNPFSFFGPEKLMGQISKYKEIIDAACEQLKEWVIKNGGYIANIHYPALLESSMGDTYYGIITHQNIDVYQVH